MTDPQKETRWQDQRYLSEHWGPTMAAQSAHAINDYQLGLVEGIKRLLVEESFGPKRLMAVLSDVAAEQNHRNSLRVQEAREYRTERLRASGGCPTCADSAKPDPTSHQKFHDQMVTP